MSGFGSTEMRLVRRMRRVLLAGTVTFVFAGVTAVGAQSADSQLATTAANTAANTASQVDVSDLIAQAEVELAQATALGHAWVVTQPLIDDATAALQAGDRVYAQALAERALATAVASVEQARLEAKTWRSRTPR